MDAAERLAQARLLVEQLEAGNVVGADQTLEQMTRGSPDLFQQIGRLTRELHEAINGFLLDQDIIHLAHHHMPDASQRLNYVIEMTENSANKTLGAIESSLPLADELKGRAEDLAARWELFRNRQMSVEDFRQLSQELTDYLQLTTQHTGQLHADLSQVLMAQDFQDITGQIIRQVITLLHDVEERLVQLIRLSGSKLPEHEKKYDSEKLEGPVVPGVDQGDVVSGQDDVDELLSSLGF